MARKRKRSRLLVEPAPPAPPAPPKVATKLGALLAKAGVSAAAPARTQKPVMRFSRAPKGPTTLPPPAPAEPLRVPEPAAVRSASERRILNDAYLGVRPLGPKVQRQRARAPEPIGAGDGERARRAEAADAEARARLDALVGGGARFSLQVDDDFVQAVREGASPKLLARVSSKGFPAEATLDLHGARAADAAAQVTGFVRRHHRAGARHLLVITGKGLHSDGGISTLRKVALEALTQGGAAPLVLAVASAHASHGGSGALAVLLQ